MKRLSVDNNVDRDERIKVSIVMPVHNTPLELLRECLDSVYAQSFKEFELICIDDASTDERIIECLNSYKKMYTEQMKIFMLETAQGAAKARNFGFEKARGKYIIFLDSDDIFHEDMLARMYENIENEQADVCVCNFRLLQGNRYIYNHRYRTDGMSEEWLCSMPTMAWNKLIRYDYLVSSKISFQSLTSCNDVYFSIMALLCTQKICVLSEEYLMDYRIDRVGSISHSNSSSKNVLNLWYAFEKVREDIKGKVDDKVEHVVDAALLMHSVGQLRTGKDEEANICLYNRVSDCFSGKKMKNAKLETIRKAFVDLDYNTRWFEEKEEFLFQLRWNSQLLIEMLNKQEVWLWGLGKRGNAFIEWANENSIEIKGACDKKDDKSGMTINGIKILQCSEVIKKKNIVIVASNGKIYNDLKHMQEFRVVNLELYCLQLFPV